MVGRAIIPMVTTVAPTMPVDAASRAPTMVTDMARPPRSRPNRRPISSSRASAIFDRSSMTPMNTNSGIAIRTSLVRMAKMRSLSAPSSAMLKAPRDQPIRAKITAMPARVKTTGKPNRMPAHMATNIRMSRPWPIIG